MADEDFEQYGELVDLEGILYEKVQGVSKRSGVVEFDQPALVRYTSLFDPTPGGSRALPENGTAHFLFTWAQAQESRWEELPGDWARVTTHYAGIPYDNGALVESSSSQSRTEPIVTHPKFENIKTYIANLNGGDTTKGIVLTAPDANGNTAFQAFGTLAGRYAGLESFEDAGIVHTVVYSSTNHSDRWSKLKKIDTPRGDPPVPPDGADWILDDIHEETKGLGFEIRETWKTSGTAGADPIIYGEATA